MPLILLILQIISSIPTVIKIIKEIVDIIHGLKGPEKKAAEVDLKAIVQKHIKAGCRDHDGCQKELATLRDNLMAKYH